MTQTIGLEPTRTSGSETWAIKVDCPEVTYLRESRYSHIPDEEFNEILRSATEMLSNCPNPESPSGRTTGIAIGKVQSGKTLSFTTLMALASANKYSRIIVLAGTKNALLMQTVKRLEKDLRITGPDYTSRILIYTNPTRSNSESVRNAMLIGKSVLFVVLKHRLHIQNVRDLLALPDIPNKPTLIIDDEGDEASLNTYFRRGEESPTYHSILELRDSLSHHAYVAYTATPQANLLLQTIDELSPDFCVFVEPGRGYCGGSVFFGDRSNEFVREISDVTEDIPRQGVIPASLEKALAVFFVGAAIRHIRAEGAIHTMLIHMTHRRDSHELMTGNVRDLLRRWADSFTLRQNDPARTGLLSLFRRAYDDLSGTIRNPPPWEQVETRLLRELQSYESHMVNSLPEGVRLAETSFQHENNIVIGGNILGRGVTIRDLAVSYMARRALQTTQADTVEQRGRWFGYKEEYLDLCRIYLPRRSIDDFQRILQFEDDFWDSMERTLRQGIPVRNWPRLFHHLGFDPESRLAPTRASVARYREFRPHGWDKQSKPIPNADSVQDNIRVIEDFLRQHQAKEEKVGVTSHTFIRDCDVHEVIENLLQKLKLEGSGWETSYYREYLVRLAESDLLSTMDVVLMRNGLWRYRSLDGDRINNLMEGRRPQKLTEGQSPDYVGDENFRDENKVQLQIHYVEYEKEGKKAKTTALALYIPETDRFDMSYIVREESL